MDSWVFDEYTELDDNLLQRLFYRDTQNEATILDLLEGEDIPAFVLDKKHLKKFNWMVELGNLFQRLMKIKDDHIINKWIGIGGHNGDPVSIFAFSFDIIDEYFVDIFCIRMITSDDNSYFCGYDHLISNACSFLLTLNQEQISVIEELLIRRLFSPGMLQPLMASDLLCFMCRMSTKYAFELLQVLFTILKEIYFEDMLAPYPIIINSYKLTIEIILKLCQRILKFLDDQEIANLISLFPISSNLTLWSNLDSNCKIAEIHFSPRKDIFSYEELVFIAKFSTEYRSSIIGPIVENFMNCGDLHETLIYLRLLTHLKFELNFDQFHLLIRRLRFLFMDNMSIFENVFRINTLKLLKPLEFVTDVQYEEVEFNNNLADLLIVLFGNCQNTVDVFYYCVTIQNIFTNVFLAHALEKLSTEKMIRQKIISHLHYLLDKDWIMNDLDVLNSYAKNLAKTYHRNLLKMERQKSNEKKCETRFIFDAAESISYEELEKPDNQAKYTIINPWPLTNDAQENYELLVVLVERMRQISFIDLNEKKRFLKVAQELISVINENS